MVDAFQSTGKSGRSAFSISALKPIDSCVHAARALGDRTQVVYLMAHARSHCIPDISSNNSIIQIFILLARLDD